MSSRRAAAAAFGAYLVVAVWWAAPSSLSPADTVPDLGDPLHLAWIMAWDTHQLAAQPWRLFETNAFYPYSRGLTFADHLLPEAVLLAPVLALTGNPVLASNVGVVLALAASALTMFLLARAVTGSAPAALVAGAAYAFNAFTLHELPRLHVLNVQWWPLAVLFLDRFAESGARRDAAGFAAALVLQALSGTYYLAYSALIAPVWLAAAYAARRRVPRWPELRALIAALAMASLPVAAIAWTYSRSLRAFAVAKPVAAGADLLAFIDRTVPSELPHFLGHAGLALVVLGTGLAVFRKIADRARPAAVLAISTAALAIALALGPEVRIGGRAIAPGPYSWLHSAVPPARAMAGPERIGILVRLGAAILVGIAAAHVLGRFTPGSRTAIGGLLATLLVVEQWSPPRPSAGAVVPTGAAVPHVYRWLADEGSGPIVELPLYPHRAKKLWALYLYFSTRHWRPLPIGRASFYPPAHELLAWNLRGFPDETSLAMLDHLGITTVVVHPRTWPPHERAERLAAVERHPRLRLRKDFDDVPPARFSALGLGEERVYTLGPSESAAPVLCVPGEALPRHGWTLQSTGAGDATHAADGDRRTAWFTAPSQQPGDRLEVLLPRAETVAAVGLDLAYPYDEFPRNLRVALRGEDRVWRWVDADQGALAQRETLEALLSRPRQARMVVRIPPQKAIAVRLALGYRESESTWPKWSVPEVHLFETCEKGEPRGGGSP